MILAFQIGILFLGVIAGTFYMALSKADGELYAYLMRFFEGLSNEIDKFAIFKNSLFDNIGMCVLIMIFGFFKPGIVGTMLVCAARGFAGGFTAAAFVRYYGMKGLFVSLASFPTSLIYFPTLVAFCAFSSCFSVNNRRKEKDKIAFYVLFSLIFFAVFCVASFFDGYVTTTFMKLLKPFVVKV